MNEKLKQSEINATAWAACDTFRGVVDPAQYKDYILVMLFLKYISDVWRDHYQAYQQQYDEERIRLKHLLEDFAKPQENSHLDPPHPNLLPPGGEGTQSKGVESTKSSFLPPRPLGGRELG